MWFYNLIDGIILTIKYYRNRLSFWLIIVLLEYVQVIQFFFAEAAVCKCSTKKLFLKILQNSLGNSCAGVSF